MTEDEALALRAARRAAFINMAEIMYGPRFGVRLSQDIDVSQGLISHIVTDRRAVTDDLEDKMLAQAEWAKQDLMTRSVALALAIDEVKRARGLLVTTVTGTVPVKQELEPDDDPEPTMTP